MRIGQKEFSEPELNAYVKELNTVLAAAVREVNRLGFMDCASCIYKNACYTDNFPDDCHYRWELADQAERLLI